MNHLAHRRGTRPLVNAFSVRSGPTRTITVPRASVLAALQDVTVSGTLFRKQVVALDPTTGRRQVSLGARGGLYSIESDGDLHFCLGALPAGLDVDGEEVDDVLVGVQPGG